MPSKSCIPKPASYSGKGNIGRSKPVQNGVKAMVISSALLAKGLQGVASSFDDDSESAAKISKWAEKLEKRKNKIAKFSTTSINVRLAWLMSS